MRVDIPKGAHICISWFPNSSTGFGILFHTLDVCAQSFLKSMTHLTSTATTNNNNHQNNQDGHKKDGDEQDFNEPIWDQSTLNTIQLIEAQYYNNNNQPHHPPNKKKQLENTSLKPSPTHLNILQLQPDTPQNIRLQRVLHHQFSPLKPSLNCRHGLYQKFRAKRGFLSVSDLVSCLWCEVQVEYGLLGKRYLKPSLRPKSFISSSGAEIKVNSSLAISRQNTLDGGTQVHAKLEKDVAPEKVKVQVVSKVDAWGLKVLNTIVSLNLLRSTGMMREIQFGALLGDFLCKG